MSDATPKGNLSAFQRWEMASFGDDRPSQIADQRMQANAAAKISQTEIDSIKKNAHLEGNAIGFKEGYASGFQEGKNAGAAEMDVAIARFQALTNNFSEQLALANLAIGQDVLNLAIDLAQAMTRSKLELDPNLIIPIVREAIEHLPSVQQPAQIFLHPDDALIIKNQMSSELEQVGWRIVIDHHIERGGCKLETAQNLIDATFTTRWQRLTDAFRSPPPSSETS